MEQQRQLQRQAAARAAMLSPTGPSPLLAVQAGAGGYDPGNAKVSQVDEQAKAKADAAVEPLYTLSEMRANFNTLRGAMRHRGGKKSMVEEVYVRLPLLIQWTTTAGANFDTVTAVAGWQAATEWASLATLYEEYIIDRFDLDFFCAYVSAYTTNTPGIWSLSYDPMSSAVIASTANGAQHSQRFLWGMNADSSAKPNPTTRDGLFHWHVKIPPKVASSTADANVRGHEWTSTSDTTTNYGYIKPYFPVLGATGTHRITSILSMHCRFRSRT